MVFVLSWGQIWRLEQEQLSWSKFQQVDQGHRTTTMLQTTDRLKFSKYTGLFPYIKLWLFSVLVSAKTIKLKKTTGMIFFASIPRSLFPDRTCNSKYLRTSVLIIRNSKNIYIYVTFFHNFDWHIKFKTLCFPQESFIRQKRILNVIPVIYLLFFLSH